ncbi:hypothetical protein HAX54_053038 [Datura stramonium]|uniref:Uncharacterized protein n=1 Tax=Datura stramonium TaxID=4076 RepID=A0ABS8WP74_DATST|nr:hypothetical protein [Datura stramonium]
MKEKQTKKKRDKQPMKDKQPKKDKQPMKRQRRLIDEEDEESSQPTLLRFPDDATVEDLHLTAPQPSQDSAPTSSNPSDSYAPKGLSWKGNASITGRLFEQLRVDKLKTRKVNGKEQQ